MQPNQPIRVLLVEDNPGDALLIREVLREAGDGRFALETVEWLRDALDAVSRGGFSVVLLDLSLPDSFGLDTFRTLQARCPGLPIVVLTGNDDETVAVQAVQEGAQDYLVKGRVEDHHLAHALRYAPSRHRRVERVVTELQQNEEELRIARQIQQALFPARPPQCPGFDIHGECRCADETGGDVFEYLTMGGGKVGLVVGDVTSHGLGPALLMAATRAYLRALVRADADAGRVLASANELLAGDVSDGRNVTLLLAEIDPAARELTYSSAGHHPPGVILDGFGRERCRLYATGLPLGILDSGAYPAGEAQALTPGDVVVLLTDGLVEARSPGGEMFGLERVLDVVRRNRQRPAREMVTAVFDAVEQFAQGPSQDDRTMIVARCLGS